MAKVVKMCDMSECIAVRVFSMLNPGKIKLEDRVFGIAIITDIEPKNLVYPEGWYYAKGTFRNKHTSTTGMYAEVPMLKFSGTFWEDIAKYSTLR